LHENYPQHYFAVGKPRILIGLFRISVAIFILPITLFDIIFGWILGLRWFYYKPLDKLLSSIVHDKVDNFLKSEMKINNPSEYSECDFFRCIAHYALEKAVAHQAKFQNYIALYGFTRTSSLLMILLFWIQILFVIMGSQININIFLIFLLLVMLIIVLFLAFIKFYRRFTLEVLMALCVIYQAPAQPAAADDLAKAQRENG
jgi:hypothetical protein